MALARRMLWLLPAILFVGAPAARAADPSAAPAVVQQFYADLVGVMKQAKQLSFDQRYARLATAISRTFNLALMTRLAVGPAWAQMPSAQQQRLDAAFSRYTISVYANRFDDYDGERFEVTPTPTSNPNGVIVSSRLVRPNGENETFNYLMRQDGAGAWKVIDVYLSGTISELAARRSEFGSVLQQKGADGLVQLIEQRTAALRAG